VIISASRRTDIPAYYGEWFLSRLKTGWCRVPNPFNRKQVAEISLASSDVDAFVFWTRDPRPFTRCFENLDRRGDPYVVLFTLTGYGPPLEPHAPPTEAALVAFRELAQRIGSDRVIWRYDPIVVGPGLTIDDHRRRFAALARHLESSTRMVKTSFLDLYRKTQRRLAAIPNGEAFISDPALHPRAEELVHSLVEIAANHGMGLEICAETHDFSHLGAPSGRCVDGALLNRLFGISVPRGADPGQRTACRCTPSRDIGVPGTCAAGCVYCYATASHPAALRRLKAHDPTAPAMILLDD